MVEEEFYKSYIYDMLKSQIKQGKKRFVLYPNGEIANLAGDVLAYRFGISPVFVADNIKFDGEKVLNLEQAAEKTEKDMYYLICSDRDNIYDIIRDNLKRYIKTEQIIDLFPKRRDEHYKSKVIGVLNSLDKEIEALEKNYVCH